MDSLAFPEIGFACNSIRDWIRLSRLASAHPVYGPSYGSSRCWKGRCKGAGGGICFCYISTEAISLGISPWARLHKALLRSVTRKQCFQTMSIVLKRYLQVFLSLSALFKLSLTCVAALGIGNVGEGNACSHLLVFFVLN